MVPKTFLFLSVLVGFVTNDIIDGGKAPRLNLNDGNSIPAIGLGTFFGFEEDGLKEVEDHDINLAVTAALDAGYRLIDTAQSNENEAPIGHAIRTATVHRDDIYIVTKLSPTKQRDPVKALRESLKKMELPSVELYLIHYPVAFAPGEKDNDIVDYVDTWKGMEQAKTLGLTKSIGVSNFNVSQMERLMENATEKPAVLQVEVNLNLAQDELLEFCKNNSILVMGHTPFGGLFDKSDKSPPPRADNETLVKIADDHKKSTPQVVLKYLVQRGVVPLPETLNKDKIEEYINIFDFELTDEEMDTLSEFNKDYRTVTMSFWQDHPYYPFERMNSTEETLN